MASRAQWERRVAQWKRSGLTAKVFAAQQGFNVHTFRGWSSSLQRPTARAVEPGFVRLVAVGSTSVQPAESATIDVVLTSGRIVRVRAGFDAALLRDVVAALEAS
jgi:transposase